MEKDLFDKVKNFQTAKKIMQLGLYPFFRSINDSEGTTVSSGGRDCVMIGSNNYLGLTHHPRVLEAAQKAVEKYGTGCTGSRFLNGNLALHEELEERLANYLGRESVLVYSTGFQSNLGSIDCIVGRKDVIYNDSENHASIYDSCRMSMGKVVKFPHNDVQRLEELLAMNEGKYEGKLIVFDGVFSMTGDIAPLPELVRLAKKYKARLYCDDAHAVGVLGPLGQGTGHHFGCHEDIDLTMGTFSKSFASIGGYIAGDSDVIHYIKHNSRSFIFSAAMPPAAVATVIECVKLIQEEPEMLDRLWANVKKMQEGFSSIGYEIGNTQTPIIPIIIGDDLEAFKFTKALYEHGVFATPVVSPAVPAGQALIRTSYMATHSEKELDYVLEVFEKLKGQFDVGEERYSIAERLSQMESQPTI